MRVISKRTLVKYWEANPRSKRSLSAWYDEAIHADWTSPKDIKKAYGNVSIVANNRVVFNIHGNTYRLVVAIKYDWAMVYVRFIGTHAEYNEIDVETI